MKRIFARGPSLAVRVVICSIASLALIVADQRGFVQPLRLGLMWIVNPIRLAVAAPTDLLTFAYESFGDYQRLLQENTELKRANSLLRTRLLRVEALERENLRLRGLLETSFKVGEHYMVAELISVNLVPYQHIVAINKGARFGVFVGQPVFETQGIAGQIIRVSPFSSEVMLITDPNHAVPVQVNRSGLRTIAVGTGQTNRLALPYLTNNADIQEGDLLVTSGLGGTFPQGYPVAKVIRAQPSEKSSVGFGAEPLAQLDRVREVLLVWSKSEPIPKAMESEKEQPLGNHGGE